MHAGRGLSGYRGISYEKKRQKAWRVKVGRKTIARFSHLREACGYVVDHKHELYPGEFSYTASNAIEAGAAAAPAVSASVRVNKPESDKRMLTEMILMGVLDEDGNKKI